MSLFKAIVSGFGNTIGAKAAEEALEALDDATDPKKREEHRKAAAAESAAAEKRAVARAAAEKKERDRVRAMIDEAVEAELLAMKTKIAKEKKGANAKEKK
jgi:hypothetical protein